MCVSADVPFLVYTLPLCARAPPHSKKCLTDAKAEGARFVPNVPPSPLQKEFPILECACVAGITAIFQFPNPYMRGGMGSSLERMFQVCTRKTMGPAGRWVQVGSWDSSSIQIERRKGLS